MLFRSITPNAVLLFTAISGTPAQDLPSAQDASIIEAHASVWHLIVEREQLRALTVRWRAMTADPDSAAACFARMLPVADRIVDQLMLTTGFSRPVLMRWLETDVGLKPYFFPPHPEQMLEQKNGGVWKFLSPLVPILLYRLVDRMMD